MPVRTARRRLPLFTDPEGVSRRGDVTKTKGWHIRQLPARPNSADIIEFLRGNGGKYLLPRIWVLTWLADHYRGLPASTVRAAIELGRQIVPLQMEVAEATGVNPLSRESLLVTLQPRRRTFAHKVLTP